MLCNIKENLNTLVDNFMNFLHNDILLSKLNGTDIEGEVCFSCTLWNEGLIYPCNSSTPELEIQPLKCTFLNILNDIECFLNMELSNSANSLFDYKSQLDRFLTLLLDLKNKIISINCVTTCDDFNIVAILLSTLIQSILKLVSILENIYTIISTFTYNCNCNCINSKIFEITMGTLINSITDFQCLLQDWYMIVMTFFHYSSSATKPYVASYVPKQPLTPPIPKPISHSCVPCPPQFNSNQYFNAPCPSNSSNCSPHPY